MVIAFRTMTRLCQLFRYVVLGRVLCPSITKRYCSQSGLLSCLNEDAVQKYVNRMEYEIDSSHEMRNVSHVQLTTLYATRRELIGNLEALKGLKDDKSKEMTDMISEEEAKYLGELRALECELLKCFAPPAEDGDEITVEVTAGVGGKEAALFSKELFEMYCNYADYKRWNSFIDQQDVSELGGIRHARIYMEGDRALRHLIQESGVHRVQRVPATEKSGRIHTSTASVAVLPVVPLIEVDVNEKDLTWETMRSSGAGGQHVNKTESAVRLTHGPSGLVVECQETRSQINNRQIALQKLKMRLNERMEQEHSSKIRGSRKSQVGTSARSDKVRTYNFSQDRITDHRLSLNIHNIPGFLCGEELLDNLIQKLIAQSEEDRITNFIQSIKASRV